MPNNKGRTNGFFWGRRELLLQTTTRRRDLGVPREVNSLSLISHIQHLVVLEPLRMKSRCTCQLLLLLCCTIVMIEHTLCLQAFSMRLASRKAFLQSSGPQPPKKVEGDSAPSIVSRPRIYRFFLAIRMYFPSSPNVSVLQTG